MAKKINPAKAKSVRTPPALSDFKRFFGKIIEDDNGCWVWQGYTDDLGYGQFSYKAKVWWVHHWSYCVFKRCLRDDDHVDHKCRNTSCCNPAHLRRVEASTHLSESGSRRYDRSCPPF